MEKLLEFLVGLVKVLFGVDSESPAPEKPREPPAEETVTGWNATGHAAEDNTMMGSSTFHADQIDHYEVRTARGEHLVTLDPG